MVKVSTSQFAYNGHDRLDITFKTGDQTFAPTKDMVYGYKYKGMSSEEYTRLYVQRMEHSFNINRTRWNQILNQDTVVLVCYCKANNFCHRVILAKLLEQLGAEYCGEIYLFNKE